METKRIVTIIVLLQVLIDIITSETAVCFNSRIAVYECCNDYKNSSGNCEECIGSWGKDCGNNCSYGYYGHGCRTRCKCGYRQICDPQNGCVAEYQAIDRAECKNKTTGENCQDYNSDDLANVKASSDFNVNPIDLTTLASLLAVSGLLILLLLGTVLYCNRKLKKEREPFKRCTVNTLENQDGQEDMIYNDIRESRMVENGGATSSSVYNLPPQFCGVTYPLKNGTTAKNQTNQSTAPLTRPRTLGLNEYGHWYRGSDNYNHINFKSTKQLCSYSDVITNDYEIFKPSTTSLKTQVNNNDCENKQ
nr:uncharacterized protein LOC105341984 isoform X1 [Crassostrea gigas]